MYSSASLRRAAISNRIPDKDVFKRNGHPLNNDRISKRLLERGWEYNCTLCGINSWKGHSLTLHLDHINGDSSDNRENNLRFLCPNCHQQTDTWGNKARVAKLEDAGCLELPGEIRAGSSPAPGTIHRPDLVVIGEDPLKGLGNVFIGEDPLKGLAKVYVGR